MRQLTMRGSELSELSLFLAVARGRSFTQAARERDIAGSAVSHAISRLEKRVGVRLFQRTTRSVSLTEAGKRLAAELTPAFAQLGTALDSLNTFRDSPFGTVRLNVPTSLATHLLRDVMRRVTTDNPGLQLDIVATDQLVDIVDQGFDAGVRLGERLSQDMVAVRLKTRLRFAVVGSRDYFSSRRKPKTPHDLRDHACVRYRFPSGAMFNWEFERDGESLDVEVHGPITTDSQELMVEAALQGCGLAYVWESRVRDHVESGALVRCLTDWCVYDDSLYLYYPSRRYVSGGLRALIAMMRA